VLENFACSLQEHGLKYKRVYQAWAQLLNGRLPAVSLEITNKCPLSCPGCYAYQPNHVNGAALETIPDLSGEDLIQGILDLLDRKKPLGLFLVGGEPLVRVRELSVLLPDISKRGIQTEIVTSGVIPIPRNWMEIEALTVVISIDGLQPEHDRRRAPATYHRILKNIEGHRVIVHCTVTSQMAEQNGSIEKFLGFWSDRAEVGTIRISLYTPQIGETSVEVLDHRQREQVVSELARLSPQYPKLRLSDQMLNAYLNPPKDPDHCIFARVTDCISADLKTEVKPCQLGGNPDCTQCGCVAAVGLQAIGSHQFPSGLKVARILDWSESIGRKVQRIRRASS